MRRMVAKAFPEGFLVVDVRGATDDLFPGLNKRSEAVAVGEGITIVQSFEPVPLYDVMEGIGALASEMGPSAFFRAYRTVKEQEAKGRLRVEIVDLLTDRFGEQNPDMGVQ